jgi:sporulation protein YlmC with PRC-barrel domain
MTQTDHSASLRSMSDDKLQTSDPAEDVRGRRVLDNTDKDIGDVDDLLVDDREHKVDDKSVHVDQTREHVASGPRYDPDLINLRHLSDVYGHYGYSPWWGPGYMYPMYPYFP